MAGFKVRRKLKATGGARIGSSTSYTDMNQDGDITQTSASTALAQATVGGTSNYSKYDTAGRLTMLGTAKVYKDIWLPAAQWYGIEPNQFASAFNANAAVAGSTNTVRPFGMTIGESGSTAQIPVLSASSAENKDARASTTFFAPPDAATTGSVECKLYFTTKLAMATSGCSQVFRLDYDYIGTGGSGDLLSGSSIEYAGSMSTVGLGLLEVWDLGDMHSFSAASPFVALQLVLANSSGSASAGSPEESIFGLKLRYVADSLGVTT